jgi:hypothetical protein
MSIDKRSVLELMGVLSVVASLIFVGMQLMLDRRVAIAGQYQNRSDLRLQSVLSQFENSDYIQDIAKSWEIDRPGWWNDEIESNFTRGKDSMSAIVRRTLRWETFAVNMDNNYYQYGQGLLENHIWANYRQQIKNILIDDSARRAYYAELSVTLPSLSELLIKLTEEIDAETRIK